MNITHDADLAEFLGEGKRIVAIGNQHGFTAITEDYVEDYRILSSMPIVDAETAENAERFNRLLTTCGYDAVNYVTAVEYLEANHNDPYTAALEFSRCNPYSADEALTAAQRNI
jgi:hypothetical protein